MCKRALVRPLKICVSCLTNQTPFRSVKSSKKLNIKKKDKGLRHIHRKVTQGKNTVVEKTVVRKHKGENNSRGRSLWKKTWGEIS